MARKVQVLLEDDVNGGPAAESVTFALDGRAYVIDLNKENAQRLRDDLAPWIAAGRREGGSRRESATASSSSRTSRRSNETASIRAWAREQGIEVSSRGRISADLRERYESAHR